MAGDIINGYQLGDCIGKGAFGTVYRGLNMETGVAVAVKQIKLVNLNKISIDVMMQEIDLLKKLNHQNIVKYMGFVKTNTFMNIIIEYCENGSLQSIYKRFGKFPENLTGVYIAQVLDGLIYLHEQGVIHRDIKGANILSTKEGLVKLADFGVATIANDDNSVVGSPYWMAPEVIELTGATTTSDIWSVGCTVIELMEGNPPYHFLDPMAALFRIVQDDHPPLPQGASPSVNDFLLQCFQKDNNLRVSAKKLLKHPWIHNARTKEEQRKEDLITFDEDLKIVQEWNEALKRNLSPQNTSDNLKSRLSPTYTQITIKGPEPPNQGMLEFTPASPTSRLKSRMIQMSSIQPEEEEDNWDDDFNVSGNSININKIRKHQYPGRKPKQPSNEDSNSLNSDNGISHKLSSLKLNPQIDMDHQSWSERVNNDPLTRYAESGDDNYDSLFGTAVILDNPYTRQLFAKRTPTASNSRTSSPSSVTVINQIANDDEEDDPFQSLEEGLEQTDLQANILRDKFARIITECKQLIKLLHPDQDESTLLDTCLKLEFLLVENPQMKYKFFNYHGILPILEMLEVSDSKDLLASLLRIINLIVYNNLEIQENLCLVGGIPVIIGLASKRYSVDIRLEVAYFIRQLCHTSTFTLQMFISCRGLKILVDFVTEDYSEQRDFTWIAINGISSVFELQTPTPKQDFCRLFTKSGLLEPLSNILTYTLNSRDASVSRYTSKIVNLLLIFSQADSYVKESMGTSITLMNCMLREIQRLPINLAIILLKCIRNLSMNPNTLDTLERANAIPILTDFLTPRNEFGVSEICNHVLNTMYNMCRINKRRQELAAQAGLIPHLQQIVAINSPLKHVALPVLCDMAHAGKVCRRILWKNNGLQFYLGLLRDPNWQTNGLEAILVWLQEDPREVEQVLIQSTYLDIIIRTFVYSRNNIVFEGLIGPLPKIIRLSPKLALAITRKSKFNNKLVEKLMSHPKALVRLSLLKILKSLLDRAQLSTTATNGLSYTTANTTYEKPDHLDKNKSQLLNCRYDITNTIRELSVKDPAVLVREMAKELLLQL